MFRKVLGIINDYVTQPSSVKSPSGRTKKNRTFKNVNEVTDKNSKNDKKKKWLKFCEFQPFLFFIVFLKNG